MCELCSMDFHERDMAIRRHRRIAGDLNRVAHGYQHLADGVIKPHSKESKIIKIRVSHLIRELVADWI